MAHDKLVHGVGAALLEARAMLATVESCTGGGIACRCTSVAGSSAWFERGFVTYSNASKTELVGVPADLIERHGAVSAETAEAMAQGGLACSTASICVAVTGIAGPDGGSADKPVGTVYIAWATSAGTSSERYVFGGDREQVRQQTIDLALSGVAATIRSAHDSVD